MEKKEKNIKEPKVKKTKASKYPEWYWPSKANENKEI